MIGSRGLIIFIPLLLGIFSYVVTATEISGKKSESELQLRTRSRRALALLVPFRDMESSEEEHHKVKRCWKAHPSQDLRLKSTGVLGNGEEELEKISSHLYDNKKRSANEIWDSDEESSGLSSPYFRIARIKNPQNNLKELFGTNYPEITSDESGGENENEVVLRKIKNYLKSDDYKVLALVAKKRNQSQERKSKEYVCYRREPTNNCVGNNCMKVIYRPCEKCEYNSRDQIEFRKRNKYFGHHNKYDYGNYYDNSMKARKHSGVSDSGYKFDNYNQFNQKNFRHQNGDKFSEKRDYENTAYKNPPNPIFLHSANNGHIQMPYSDWCRILHAPPNPSTGNLHSYNQYVSRYNTADGVGSSSNAELSAQNHYQNYFPRILLPHQRFWEPVNLATQSNIHGRKYSHHFQPQFKTYQHGSGWIPPHQALQQKTTGNNIILGQKEQTPSSFSKTNTDDSTSFLDPSDDLTAKNNLGSPTMRYDFDEDQLNYSNEEKMKVLDYSTEKSDLDVRLGLPITEKATHKDYNDTQNIDVSPMEENASWADTDESEEENPEFSTVNESNYIVKELQNDITKVPNTSETDQSDIQVVTNGYFTSQAYDEVENIGGRTVDTKMENDYGTPEPEIEHYGDGHYVSDHSVSSLHDFDYELLDTTRETEKDGGTGPATTADLIKSSNDHTDFHGKYEILPNIPIRNHKVEESISKQIEIVGEKNPSSGEYINNNNYEIQWASEPEQSKIANPALGNSRYSDIENYSGMATYQSYGDVDRNSQEQNSGVSEDITHHHFRQHKQPDSNNYAGGNDYGIYLADELNKSKIDRPASDYPPGYDDIQNYSKTGTLHSPESVDHYRKEYSAGETKEIEGHHLQQRQQHNSNDYISENDYEMHSGKALDQSNTRSPVLDYSGQINFEHHLETVPAQSYEDINKYPQVQDVRGSEEIMHHHSRETDIDNTPTIYRSHKDMILSYIRNHTIYNNDDSTVSKSEDKKDQESNTSVTYDTEIVGDQQNAYSDQNHAEFGGHKSEIESYENSEQFFSNEEDTDINENLEFAKREPELRKTASHEEEVPASQKDIEMNRLLEKPPVAMVMTHNREYIIPHDGATHQTKMIEDSRQPWDHEDTRAETEALQGTGSKDYKNNNNDVNHKDTAEGYDVHENFDYGEIDETNQEHVLTSEHNDKSYEGFDAGNENLSFLDAWDQIKHSHHSEITTEISEEYDDDEAGNPNLEHKLTSEYTDELHKSSINVGNNLKRPNVIVKIEHVHDSETTTGISEEYDYDETSNINLEHQLPSEQNDELHKSSINVGDNLRRPDVFGKIEHLHDVETTTGISEEYDYDGAGNTNLEHELASERNDEFHKSSINVGDNLKRPDILEKNEHLHDVEATTGISVEYDYDETSNINLEHKLPSEHNDEFHESSVNVGDNLRRPNVLETIKHLHDVETTTEISEQYDDNEAGNTNLEHKLTSEYTNELHKSSINVGDNLKRPDVLGKIEHLHDVETTTEISEEYDDDAAGNINLEHKLTPEHNDELHKSSINVGDNLKRPDVLGKIEHLHDVETTTEISEEYDDDAAGNINLEHKLTPEHNDELHKSSINVGDNLRRPDLLEKIKHLHDVETTTEISEEYDYDETSNINLERKLTPEHNDELHKSSINVGDNLRRPNVLEKIKHLHDVETTTEISEEYDYDETSNINLEHKLTPEHNDDLHKSSINVGDYLRRPSVFEKIEHLHDVETTTGISEEYDYNETININLEHKLPSEHNDELLESSDAAENSLRRPGLSEKIEHLQDLKTVTESSVEYDYEVNEDSTEGNLAEYNKVFSTTPMHTYSTYHPETARSTSIKKAENLGEIDKKTWEIARVPADSPDLVGSPRELLESSCTKPPEVGHDAGYFGRLEPLKSDGDNIKSVEDLDGSDLFYIGDGVRLPLTIKKLKDGSFALTISDSFCQQRLSRKECPCCVPREGKILQEPRIAHEKKASGSVQRRDVSTNEKMNKIISNKSLQEGKRLTRSVIMPVDQFAHKYNLVLNVNDQLTNESSTLVRHNVIPRDDKSGSQNSDFAQQLVQVSESSESEKKVLLNLLQDLIVKEPFEVYAVINGIKRRMGGTVSEEMLGEQNARYDYQKDNPILERIKIIKNMQKAKSRCERKYQKDCDDGTIQKTELLTTILHWLKRLVDSKPS